MLWLKQQLTYIHTPKGNLVPDTYYTPETITGNDVLYILGRLANEYPNAIIVDNPTNTYNCHAYAWHVSEGGSAVWMGLSSNPTSIYWTDGSYFETGQSSGHKVAYLSSNHSAIATSTSDVFISKWGNWHLLQHHKDDSPYNASSLKYYTNYPIINGPPIIGASCSGTYTISNLPPGVVFNRWEVGSGVTIQSSDAASCTVQRTNNIFHPDLTQIRYIFTVDSQVITASLLFVARVLPYGFSLLNSSNYLQMPAAQTGQPYRFRAIMPVGQDVFVQQYQWQLFINGVRYDFTGFTTAPFTFYDTGTFSVNLRVLDGCEWSRWCEFFVEVY